MNEKEMIERYIYEVTRRVSQDMREEISMELQALIEDMQAEEGTTIEEVLKKLGSPAEFAKRYKDGPEYLIGPDYYDNYMWVVKIALIGIGISAIVSGIVQGLTNITGFGDFFSAFFGEVFANAINGAYSVVGVITIIFAVLEWQKVKVSIKPEEKWSVSDLSKNVANVKSWTPSSLPPIPDKRAVISRGDSVISIIFITVFMALLIFAPQLFGVFHKDGKEIVNISCIFNLDEWDRIMPVFIAMLFVGLVDEIIQMVTGYYCKAVMYTNIICNAIQIFLTIMLLKVLPLWNPTFADDVLAYKGREAFAKGDMLRFWGSEGFNNGVLLLICVITLIEVTVTVYKTQKYNK